MGELTVEGLPASGLRRLAMPVVVVAAEHEGRRSGSTATTSYVTLDPPTLVVSLARHSTTTALVRASGRFSVSALAADQAETALAAGGRAVGPDKFVERGIPAADADEEFTVVSVAGVPVAWCCRVASEQPIGEHLVVVGEVLAVRGTVDDRPPLLRHERRYVGLGAVLSVQDEGGYPL